MWLETPMTIHRPLTSSSMLECELASFIEFLQPVESGKFPLSQVGGALACTEGSEFVNFCRIPLFQYIKDPSWLSLFLLLLHHAIASVNLKSTYRTSQALTLHLVCFH